MTNDQSAEDIYLGQYAGFATRLAAFVIDLVVVTVVISVIAMVAKFIVDSLQSLHLLPLSNLTTQVALIITILIILSFYLFYYVGFLMLLGQTPGKWIMGVRVVGTHGERVGLGRAVLRLIGYYLSGILFIGYLWILVDQRRQGLHDKIATTLVVYSWPEPQAVVPPRGRQRRSGTTSRDTR